MQPGGEPHDRLRRWGARLVALPDGTCSHVDAAFDEGSLDLGQREAVGLDQVREPRGPAPHVRLAEEVGERPDAVVGHLELPEAGPGRIEADRCLLLLDLVVLDHRTAPSDVANGARIILTTGN